MKKLVLISGLAVMALTTACKKNRSCECKNANGTYPAGEIEATKSKAKKHCESLSTGSTECSLK